jgi:hypothetical protein
MKSTIHPDICRCRACMSTPRATGISHDRTASRRFFLVRVLPPYLVTLAGVAWLIWGAMR